jgi:hypothetical protein
MKTIRLVISVIAAAFLVLGYAASQNAALTGAAQEYAAKIDCPPVQWFALALLVLCVVFAFIGDKEADET